MDKYRADPARDAQRLTELKPKEHRYWSLVAERKGAQDARMLEFRWLLEELRVSFFSQELRTPQPVRHQAAGEGLGAVESLKGDVICATGWHNFNHASRLQNPPICQMDA